jgi:L-threonylcarbamoyladenylate synthase
MGSSVNLTGSSRRKSPGFLDHHYAPRASLCVLSWKDEVDLSRQLARFELRKSIRQTRAQGGRKPFRRCVIAHTHIPSGKQFHRVSVVPHDPEAFARALYAELHQCDDEGAGLIIVEAVPDAPSWQGIADRLRRAARGR